MIAFRPIVPLAMAFAAPIALSHHSPAAYDVTTQITVAGVVERFDWGNPHAYLTVKESAPAGTPRTWLLELVSPSVLRQFGWTPTTLAQGEPITFTALPGRNRSRNIAYLLLLERSGEVMLDMRGMAPGARPADAPAPSLPLPSTPAFTATTLAGTWATLPGPGFSLLLPNSAELPVTPKGAAAIREFTDLRNPGRDCVQFPAPIYMVLPFFRTIEIGEEAVVIRGEEGGLVRTVDLRRSTHAGVEPSIQGDSIGWWEGDVLVVDTALFAEHALGNGGGLPSSPMKHLVERFGLAPNGRTLQYTFSLDDPEYLTRTVEGSATWAYRPDVEFTPLACDLENARRFLEE